MGSSLQARCMERDKNVSGLYMEELWRALCSFVLGFCNPEREWTTPRPEREWTTPRPERVCMTPRPERVQVRRLIDFRGRFFGPGHTCFAWSDAPGQATFRGCSSAREAIFGDFGRFLTLDTHVSLPFGHPPAPPVSPRPDENLLVRGLVGIQPND